MGLIETASANSVWRGMDYYEAKKVISWEKTGTFAYDGVVSGSDCGSDSGVDSGSDSGVTTSVVSGSSCST